ncbi:hypothetical protein EIP91_009624 [Steccherinum ochraceum]|uniref:Major facilitator superfamily (MFS) profile domain-containing protein n=1 Tax=Steccherinum ochraceum TaxID=92696 RepID=A0A4R0R1F8_9APHY|nr:hypothetical protein EIP91_009624 [Steccherinum ochraceum]
MSAQTLCRTPSSDEVTACGLTREDPTQPSQLAVQPPELPLARRLLIMGSIVGTQVIQMSAFSAGISASFVVPQILGHDNVASAPWVAASYPLAQAAFILPGGRLGTIYGHHNLLFIGCFLWVALTIGSAFSPNFVTLCALRGASGIGGGIMVPNAVALLTITFPPGRMRNIGIGLFGAAAPFGAAAGGVIIDLLLQFAEWKWCFIFLAILGAVVFIAAFLAAERDKPLDPDGKIDFVGAYLGMAALFLFKFVWNQAPAVGWQTAYEIVLLVLSIVHGVAFCVWEAKFASEPIVPFNIGTRPSFSALVATVLLSLMGFGIYVYYFFLWQFSARHYTLTAMGGALGPFALVSIIMAFVSALLVAIMKIQYILGLGVVSLIIACLLVATMPDQQVYWAQAFPSSFFAGAGPDLLITAAQVIASSSVRRSEQGVAGSLIGVLQVYGLSTGLGFAGTVEVHVNKHGADPVLGYRGGMFLALGFLGLAFIINLFYVRMPADTQVGWREDDLKVRREGEDGEATTVDASSEKEEKKGDLSV